jgi:RNA polymerase sigma-70 factor, ECF subfamily
MIGESDMEAAQILTWYSGMHMVRENAPDIFDADAQLMLRFKRGDAEAFDQLFARHTHAMVNFAFRFVRDRRVAEELAQEIFLRVYEGAAHYTIQSRFTTWLYRIATNVCLNEVRKPQFKAVHQPLSIERGPDPGPPLGGCTNGEPQKLLERQALANALREALERIPEKQRTAFMLNKYQELSYTEVAGIMKTSEKAVKSLIHRAKETLAERLKSLMPGLLNQ